MKKYIRVCVLELFDFLHRFSSFRTFSDLLISSSFSATSTFSFDNINFVFLVPNKLCRWRVDTFSTKEPETLEWINSFQPNSVFFDVGANIGLYSIYAAKAVGAEVYSFEPSVFNLPVLAKNIYLNDLSDSIAIFPLPLSNTSVGISTLSLSTDTFGGALHTFQETYTWDSSPINITTSYKLPGLSLDKLFDIFLQKKPRYLKIDVDGIEHLILAGGTHLLATVESLQVEINDNFHEQESLSTKLLTELGFVRTSKRHSEMISNSSSGFANTFNQVWVNTSYSS